MSSVQKPDSEVQRSKSSKQPYTIVVEGNIGSGKVMAYEHKNTYQLK